MSDSSESKNTQEAAQQLQSQLKQLAEQKLQLQQEISQYEARLHDLSSSTDQQQQDLSDYSKKLNKANRQLNTLIQSAGDKIQAQSRIDTQIKQLEQSQNTSDEKQALLEKSQALKVKIQDENKYAEELNQQISQLNTEMQQQQAKHAEQQQQLKEQADLLSSKSSEVEELQHQISEISSKLDADKRRHFQLAAKKSECAIDKNHVETLVNEKKKYIDENRPELDSLTKKLKEITLQRIEAEQKLQSIDQVAAQDPELHKKLKNAYESVLNEIRAAETEASERNSELENFHSQYENKHDQIIKDFEDNRNEIIKKQKALRQKLNEITDTYHQHLEKMTADLDHRNQEKQKLSVSASDQLKAMQEDLAESELQWQKRLDEGESDTIINAEREHKQLELNEFTKTELDRLSQQEQQECEARELQIKNEDTYLEQQAQLEQELQQADDELTTLTNNEQQALQKITSQQQLEETELAKKRAASHEKLSALRDQLKVSSNALVDYEALHSESSRFKHMSESSLIEKTLNTQKSTEADLKKRVAELEANLNEAETQLKLNADKLKVCSPEMDRITAELNEIDSHKKTYSGKLLELDANLEKVKLSDDKQQKLQEIERQITSLSERKSEISSEYQEKISNLEQDKNKHIKQCENFEEDLVQVEEKIKSLDSDTTSQHGANELKEKKQQLDSEIESINASAEELKRDIFQYEEKIKLAEQQDVKADVAQLEEVIKSLHAKKLSLDSLNIESATITESLNKIQQKLQRPVENTYVTNNPDADIAYSDVNSTADTAEPKVLTADQRLQRKNEVEAAIREMKQKHKGLMSKDQVVRAEADEKIYQQIVDKVKNISQDDQASKGNYRTEEALYEEFLRILAERKKTGSKETSPELDRVHRQLSTEPTPNNPATEALTHAAVGSEAASLRRELLEQAAVESESNPDIIAYKALMEDINSSKDFPKKPDSPLILDAASKPEKVKVPEHVIDEPEKIKEIPEAVEDVSENIKDTGESINDQTEHVQKVHEFKQHEVIAEEPVTENIKEQESLAVIEKKPEVSQPPKKATKAQKIKQAQGAVANLHQKIEAADPSMHLHQTSAANSENSTSIDKKAETEDLDFISSSRDAVLSERSRWGPALMYSIIFFIAVAIVWSKLTVLDEITSAQGKVIPSSQIQVIQNLEGGILSELFVREGDTVKKGQTLLRIDDTRFSSSFKEGEQKYVSLLVAISRLKAEAAGADKITFPDSVRGHPDVIKNAEALFNKQKQQMDSSTQTLQNSYDLAVEELAITKPLVKEGLMSQLELLRLKRQVNELKGDIDKVQDEFRSNAQKELNEKKSEYSALTESLKAAKDRLTRTTVRSPVNGTVNLVHISTVGAVIQPGVSILEIVPTEDNLLVEAKIKPQDIAFIRPGQHAVVKITAYDYTVYGGLDGVVEHISADTIEEEKQAKNDESYYKILVRTDKNYLGSEKNPLYIIPGMTVSVDVMTGKKSVLDYLMKPILKARQSALRER